MFSMYSIGDGKRKLIYSYKTLESLKLKPYKNIKRNFLVLKIVIQDQIRIIILMIIKKINIAKKIHQNFFWKKTKN